MFKLDTTAFRASMTAGAKRLSALVVESLRRTSAQTAGWARVNTLFRSRTGRLRAGISSRLTSRTSARVTSSAKHSHYVEDGTRPHVIRPRRKKALRFVQNGVVRFAKQVNHPGTKPRPFMKQARDRAEPLFDRLCREAVERMFS